MVIYRGYFLFEVNTKYISSSVLKTSEWYLLKKVNFLFILYFLEDFS